MKTLISLLAVAAVTTLSACDEKPQTLGSKQDAHASTGVGSSQYAAPATSAAPAAKVATASAAAPAKK